MNCLPNKIEKITKKQWKKFVSNNATNSYNLTICLAILCFWEEEVDNEEDALEVLIERGLSLSDRQVNYATNFALNYEPINFEE